MDLITFNSLKQNRERRDYLLSEIENATKFLNLVPDERNRKQFVSTSTFLSLSIDSSVLKAEEVAKMYIDLLKKEIVELDKTFESI